MVTHSRSDIVHLLRRHDIRPSRALGQNFVADANTVRRIAQLAQFEPGQPVLEIGAGLGSLSLALLEAKAKLTCVEVDRRLLSVLRDIIEPKGAQVIEGDALGLDWEAVLAGSSDWLLVANLPYNVATPLVAELLDHVPPIRRMLVMVQREVGERLVAPPGNGTYGAVSVKVAYWATGKVVARVPPSVFVPRPRVESVLVRITRRDRPAVDPQLVSPTKLFDLVRLGFGQRRKMLRKTLADVIDDEGFARARVRPQARPEELSVDDWGRLATQAR